MATRAELLFQRRQTLQALANLRGKPEDADFDCKVWSNRQDGMRNTIAKATCGFANATGGVIVVGVEAKGGGADMPDIVQALRPVSEPHKINSIALDIILNSVEPGIEGVRSAVVMDDADTTTGYVLLYIPEQEGAPRRTKTDWRFYVRIASGTVPMEFFQIEDRFGRRPHPRLTVLASDPKFTPGNHMASPARELILRVRNIGKGLARFPALFFAKNPSLHYSAGAFGSNPSTWAFKNIEDTRYAFRGSSNDVLYPEETITIATLRQVGVASRTSKEIKFERVTLKTTVVCEGMMPVDQEFFWDACVETT